jgi:hypothetical protein
MRLATLLCFFGVAFAAHATVIAISLDNTTLTGQPGDVLTFSGDLTNTTAATVYLTSAQINLADPDLTGDGTPFLLNAPISVGPGGDSGDFDLFTVTIADPLTLSAGTYAGTIDVLSGPSFGSQSFDDQVGFQVDVQSGSSDPTPEPATFLGPLLFFAGLLWKQRRRLAGLAAVLPLAAQDPAFHAETRLSLVHFHVVQGQRYVGGVKVSDLELLQDGVARPITLLGSGGTETAATPVELILLFDESPRAMTADLLSPLLFREQLLDALPNVRLAVYGFTRSLRKYTDPTRDFEKLSAAFEALRAGHPTGELIPLALFPKRKAEKGETWLYEAVRGAAADAAQREEKVVRDMLVFSGGLGNTTAEPRDAAAVCEEVGIEVYPVLLGHQRGVERFAQLADLTGGRSFDPPSSNLDRIQKVLEAMAVLVRTEYVAGFSPEPSSTPRKHRIEMKLLNPALGKILGGHRDATF